ncbi:hypothetical protein BG000_006253, partial [Podila horticola]
IARLNEEITRLKRSQEPWSGHWPARSPQDGQTIDQHDEEAKQGVLEQQDEEVDQRVLEQQDEEADQGVLEQQDEEAEQGIIYRLWQHRLKVVSGVVLKGMQADLDGMIKDNADAICDTYLRNTEVLMEQFNNVDVNAAIFIRDMMVYMELNSSIKAGDVGRILN